MDVFKIHIVAGLVTIVLLISYIYIRISYGFWFYQPVFHLYDIYSYLFPCGIVEYDMPRYTKFTNLEDITMFSVHDLLLKNNYKWKQFVNFIGSQYHRAGDNSFLPRLEHITPYFTNHSHPCFVSFYYDRIFLENVEKSTMIPTNKIVSVMTSRPMEIIFNKTRKTERIRAYYIDYLCVHKDYRKRGIAPEIIQTHYYSQRRRNKDIHVNLFKREGELTGIVPLCIYTSHLFPLSHTLQIGALPPYLNVVECTKTNLFYLSDFMKDKRDLFDLNICCEVSNMLDLVNSGNYLMYFIIESGNVNEEKIVGCIILKRTRVFIQKDKEMLSCIASIKDPDLSDEFFYEAFKIALSKIKIHVSYLMVENISHNNHIVNEMQRNGEHAIVVSPMAYFFHNFVYNTALAHKVIVLGT